MPDNALDTLFHPFDAGTVDWPEGPVLVLGAVPGMARKAPVASSIAAVQGFRPHFLALRAEGIACTPELAGSGYAMTLVLSGRFRALNEKRLAEALAHTRAGGLIVVAGGKTDGIATLRKAVEARLPLAGTTAKYHGNAFWFERPDDARAVALADGLTPRSGLVEDRFRTAPGLFSAEKVDSGSRLLADSLPRDIKGKVADFCAGWGYLSARVVADFPRVRVLDLYEAEHAAIEAARANVSAARDDVAIGFHWADLVTEKPARRYDTIVMNPPFHQGRAADPELGVAIIKAAHGALERGGRLFLVANTPLPYEKVLAAQFHAVGEIARADGFKVLQATR